MAVFTNNHALFNGLTVANYIGFFSILWSTWFHVAIYDVRFYVDSSFTRLCKMIFYAVMTSFVGLDAVYDTIDEGGTSRAFQGLALVLMLFRFILMVQYGTVLYFVPGFHKTLVPLLLMMVTYLLTGIAFLATYLSDRGVNLDGLEGTIHVYAWYIILAVEVVAVVLISSIWRVLSFKHTHLVERVGLLTLIIIGEGIIGLLKSLAYVISGTTISIWAEVGVVAASVFLIYFIYLLYFESVVHERFGSVRQQFWTLLHYFMHVALLLTVEGQSGMIIWQAVWSSVGWLVSVFPTTIDKAVSYGSVEALVNGITGVLNETTARYHGASLTNYYDPVSDLAKLQSSTNGTEFASAEWNETVSETLRHIQYGIEYFIFNNFHAEADEAALEETKDPEEQVQIFSNAYKVIFEFFYIAAGCLLIILALLYIFGRNKKKAHEWSSVGLRLAVGMALPCVSAVAFFETEGDHSTFRFLDCAWIVGVVTFCYLAVLLGDNIIGIWFNMRGSEARACEAGNLEDGESSYTPHTSANGHPNEKRLGSQNKPPHVHDGIMSEESDTIIEQDNVRPVRYHRSYSHLHQDDQHEAR